MDDKQKVETIKHGLEYIHGILSDVLNNNIDNDEILTAIELLELMRDG